MTALRTLCRTGKIKWTLHALMRIRDRKIQSEAIVNTLIHGEEVAYYDDDKPFPSHLVFNGDCESPLHVVASANAEFAYIITAYIPSLDEWESDYKTRREH